MNHRCAALASSLLIQALMQNTLASHGRLAASILLVGVVGCSDSLDLSSENSAPTATSTTLSLAEDGIVSGRLAAEDPEGDELQLSIVAAPRAGTLSLDGDRFTYRPNPNFHGEDQLTFVARDRELSSAAARVTFRVAPIDDAPQLGSNIFRGPAGFRIAGQIAATDLDGDPLSFAVPSPISGVFVELDTATGRFVYEPFPALASTDIVPIGVVGNGVVATGQLVFDLEPVSFAGTWLARDVRVDGAPCAGFTLPIQTPSSTEATLLAHAITCGPDETIEYEPMPLILDAPSPSSLHASKDLALAPETILRVAVTIDPIPDQPNTYRYVETFSGAFDQVVTATLTRA